LLALLVSVGSASALEPPPNVRPLPDTQCGPVEYGGAASRPSYIIATDFPMQGASRQRSLQMVQAVRTVLGQRKWDVNGLAIGLQACDDADPHTGAWTAAKCNANAAAYAADFSVLAVIGTYNSGCAALMLPVLNKAHVLLISPGNTLVCLTEYARSCAKDEPGKYAPTGTRSYARVVPNDAYQGAALATYAVKKLHAKRLAILSGGDATSDGQAAALRGAAKALKAKVVFNGAWGSKPAKYPALMRKVKKAKPTAVLLAGLTEQHGGQLIRAKKAVLGSNAGKVKLLALDGFAQTSTITVSGSAAKGMFASTPGLAPQLLTTAKGKAMVAALKATFPGQAVEPFAPYAGEAADVVLDRIAVKYQDRAAIASSVFDTKITDGIIGSFSLSVTGDPVPGKVTVSKAGSRTFAPIAPVSPAEPTVEGALGAK
jgi:branched-chain amino acid transport system substrate-binding protein